MVETELCGKFMLEDGFRHMRRRMSFNELILMTEGEMYICEDGVDFYDVKKGDMLFLRAGRTHYGYKDSQGPVAFFWFHFKTDDETLRGLVSHFTPAETAYITMLYNRLFFYSTISREATNCAATLLLTEAAEAMRGTQKTNPTAENIRAWIEANAFKKITVSGTAHRFGYNPDYVSRIIKELTGSSVKEYITSLRMDRAMELLLSSDLSVKQISSICGYDDCKQFLKLFKKRCGVTPKEYRRTYRHSIINTV